MYKIFLFIYFSFIIADIPEGYYDEALGLSGSALRSALHEIIDNHIQQSYSSLHEHFEITDIKPNGSVWDIYSDVPFGDPSYDSYSGVIAPTSSFEDYLIYFKKMKSVDAEAASLSP